MVRRRARGSALADVCGEAGAFPTSGTEVEGGYKKSAGFGVLCGWFAGPSVTFSLVLCKGVARRKAARAAAGGGVVWVGCLPWDRCKTREICLQEDLARRHTDCFVDRGIFGGVLPTVHKRKC